MFAMLCPALKNVRYSDKRYWPSNVDVIGCWWIMKTVLESTRWLWLQDSKAYKVNRFVWDSNYTLGPRVLGTYTPYSSPLRTRLFQMTVRSPLFSYKLAKFDKSAKRTNKVNELHTYIITTYIHTYRTWPKMVKYGLWTVSYSISVQRKKNI